jgi:protocatechuate 3,4-dioxygenase beta subunit
MDSHRFTRRASLLRFGGLVASAAGIGAGAAEAGSGPAGVASGAVSCVLSPEMTEGPYYIADEALRRNITEGKPGTPLRLRLSVVDASTCRAIAGAAVDVWHCDAGGLYSGFIAASTGNGGPGPGGGRTDKQTFLRGVQRTNGKGVAVFATIYPGWYRGRTVHVHVKVHVGGNVVHTGQLFFPEPLTDAVYRRSPYSKRTGRDTTNATDAIFRNGGSRSLLSLNRHGNGYVGSIVMGVHRT